jgi:hypothetical protein
VAVEDQDDIDGYFDTDEFAEAGVFTPAPVATSHPQPVTVLLNRGDGEVSFGHSGVVGPLRKALLRKSEVAAPLKGDQLDLVDDCGLVIETYKLQADGQLDTGGFIYQLDLELV